MLLASQKNTYPIVWSIAGSDSGGGAGIQADLKAFNDFYVHGCTVISALTAQNTCSLAHVDCVDVETFRQQLLSLKNDLPAKVIKTGMLANEKIVNALCDFLEQLKLESSEHNQENSNMPLLVCDPVLTASVGGELLSSAALEVLRQRLLPLVDVLTPNLIELEILSGKSISSLEDIEAAAKQLLSLGVKAVYVKGGHTEKLNKNSETTEGYIYDFFISKSTEHLVTAPQQFYLRSEKLEHVAHGTGCRLASALAALLAHDYALEDALTLAKAYLSVALENVYQVGGGEKSMPSISDIALKHLPYVVFKSPDEKADENHDANKQEAKKIANTIDLYPVVDDISWLEKLLPLGIKTIQLRLKDKSLDEVERQIKTAVNLQKEYSAQLFINDYWQLAIKHGAYGVHIGQEDLFEADVTVIKQAGLALGISTHGWWEIARAHSQAPSYIAIGPIYPTQTKVMPFHSQGLEKLAQWNQLLEPTYPVVAIGGINLQRAQDVLAQGVKNIALVSAITHAEDYQQATKDLQDLFV